MPRTIVMHIDDAPWIRGGPRAAGVHPEGGGQLVGDRERGPISMDGRTRDPYAKL